MSWFLGDEEMRISIFWRNSVFQLKRILFCILLLCFHWHTLYLIAGAIHHWSALSFYGCCHCWGKIEVKSIVPETIIHVKHQNPTRWREVCSLYALNDVYMWCINCIKALVVVIEAWIKKQGTSLGARDTSSDSRYLLRSNESIVFNGPHFIIFYSTCSIFILRDSSDCNRNSDILSALLSAPLKQSALI